MTDSATPDIGGRIAIISDVHGNRHALEAVRRAQRQAGVTRTWCLGDMVGYGAHPNECLRACVHVSERCIAGNHDLAAAGRVPINVFSPWARTAIEWTRTQLDRNALDRLAGLEPLDTDGDVALFHASPRDPVWEYVLDGDGVRAAMDAHPARVMMVGHTHLAGAWCLGDDGRLDGGLVRGERPSQSSADAGSSIPGRSASPAISTRVHRGRCSTPRPPRSPSDARPTTFRVHRTPFRPQVFPWNSDPV